MANLAQTVNVLQAVALTEGEKMILTPTYHVFKMYTVHHDAQLLPVDFDSRSILMMENLYLQFLFRLLKMKPEIPIFHW